MNLIQSIDFKSIAQFAVSFNSVQIFCSSIILVSIAVYVFGFRRKASALIKNLTNVIGILRQTTGPKNFAVQFANLDKVFCENKDIGHCWSEFKETLVMPSATAAEPVVCNTEESVCFFNENTVIANRINLRFYNSFPNYLTGTGILGTFLGLVAGIYLASHGLASENTAELHNSLQNLLSGASLAFWTSICGLICSILFSGFEKLKTNRLGLLLSEWNREMGSRIERITPESLARQQLKQLEKQSEYLEEFTTQVAFNIAEALNDRLNEKIVPVMERMIESVDSLRRDRGESNEEMLKEIVQQFSKTMDEAAGKELNALSETLTTLNETLVPLLGQLNEAHQSMQGAALFISEQIKESYEKSSKEFSEGVQAAIADLIDGISSAGTTLNGGLKDAFDHAVGKLQDTIDNLDSSIHNVREASKNTENMAEATKGLLVRFDGIADSLSTVQGKINSSLSSLEKTAENIKIGGDAVFDMTAQANQALSEFRGVVENFQSSQQTVESTWKNYTDRFERVDSSLEGVFRQIENGLKSYAEATSNYMGDLDRHSAKITGLLGGAVKDLNEYLHDFSEAISNHRH